MRKYIYIFLTGSLFACFFSSCASIVPVTDEIISQVGERVDSFQYYVSRTIVLNRTDNQTDGSIVKGKARIVNKMEKNKVTIKKSTPGVLLRYRDLNSESKGEYVLSVSFEEDDKYFLQFFRYNNRPNAHYNLAVTDNDNKILFYGGEPYQYSFPTKKSPLSLIGLGKQKVDGEAPYLLIKLNKKLIKKVNKRVAKGRTLK